MISEKDISDLVYKKVGIINHNQADEIAREIYNRIERDINELLDWHNATLKGGRDGNEELAG